MSFGAFDDILELEEIFYGGGFRQGLADGVKAGRIEGRTFGLEKGFEKYLKSGRLYGKSLIWANRLPQHRNNITSKDTLLQAETATTSKTQDHHIQASQALPSLPDNQRLVKHLQVLHALSESESLSTENTEEAVSDFDDRLKRAQGKAKVIERMVGEVKVDVNGDGALLASVKPVSGMSELLVLGVEKDV